MASREQVRELLDRGLDYDQAGERLGIPPGQAYLIATGRPADGGDAPSDSAGRARELPASQHLANPPHHNPTTNESVLEWIAARAAADGQMREAAADQARDAGGNPPAERKSKAS